MFIRKIGKSILGKSTPFQLVAGCTLGAILGFAPGLGTAPLLIPSLLLALAVLNTNLWLAALVTVGAKIASWSLLSVTTFVGAALLDGPTGPLLGKLINAPVLAYFGLEYYSVTGGLVVAALAGGGLGLALCSGARALRRQFISFSDRSDRFDSWASSRKVRLLSWLLLGIRPDRAAFEKLNRRRVGRPVRVSGVAFAALALVLAFILPQFLAAPILTPFLRDQLARANGATVDLAEAEIDLASGRLVIRGLALADPDDLGTDRFYCRHFEADIDTTDLLRKRFRVERLTIVEASAGSPRRERGERLQDEPPSRVAIAEENDAERVPEGVTSKTLEEFLAEAAVWEERLRKIDRTVGFLSRFTHDEASDEAGDPGSREDVARPTQPSPPPLRRSRIESGRADHLIQDSPLLRIDELRIERLQALAWGEVELSIEAHNVSTHPGLVPDPISIAVRDLDGRFEARLSRGDRQNPERGLQLRVHDIPADLVASQLRASDLIQGGRIDFDVAGSWHAGRPLHVDLPLRLQLRDSLIRLPGSARPHAVARLELPFTVQGSLTAPSLTFEKQEMVDALVDAGQKELATQVRARLQGERDEAESRLRAAAEEELEKRVDSETRKRLEEDLRMGSEAKEELKKKAGSLLPGVLPKKKEGD